VNVPPGMTGVTRLSLLSFCQPTPAYCASLSTQHTVVWRVMSTASNSSLKQSCSALTSVTSALEVIFNVMRSINPHFTYFTYLLSTPKTLSNSTGQSVTLLLVLDRLKHKRLVVEIEVVIYSPFLEYENHSKKMS